MECKANKWGDLYTKLNGLYHSFNDEPAIIYVNGDQEWYRKGKLHRDSHFPGREDDLPAVIYANGDREWYKKGKCHRDSYFPGRENDLPAVIRANKAEWWVDGIFIKCCNNYRPRVKSAKNI